MPRNLDRRVEAVVPITDPALQQGVDEVLDALFADKQLAWEQHDDQWAKLAPGVGGQDVQQLFEERANKRAEVGLR